MLSDLSAVQVELLIGPQNRLRPGTSRDGEEKNDPNETMEESIGHKDFLEYCLVCSSLLTL